MSCHVIISDIIGKKSGMHYYHSAEIRSLEKKGRTCSVKSNYPTDKKHPYYPNIFRGFIFFRLLRLSKLYCKFIMLCVSHNEDEIRHYWYGTWVDVPFLIVGIFFKNVVFDIHEIVMLDYRGRFLLKLIESFFGFSRNKFIVHNDLNYRSLSKVIDCNRISVIPHPTLSPPTKYTIDNIPDKYVNFISRMKARGISICLFFGDLRPSKGIHEVLKLCENNYGDVSFLICGQDIFGIQPSKSVSSDKVLISPRRQSDEELAFLFSNSNIILLPYKNSSQSGVLEVARFFEKPVVFSNHMTLISKDYEFSKLICNFDDDIDVVRSELIDFSKLISGFKKDQKRNLN